MLTDDMVQTVQRLLASKKDVPGALLVLLHDIQDALGYVPDDAVPLVAKELNLSRAEVHGVLTYYHYFRRTPAGRHVVQLCRAEACQACGADELLARAEALLGCKLHETRADGAVTLEPVYCLGLCAAAPAMQVDERLHARVTPAVIERLADQMEISS
ncbi:formate dehydrogenase subunit gamma [Rhodoferax sp.]|uniref:formate dehydrogenase subunit gamma n=1 Tax=Rhodoferax sp. TaxID=50421 RepID=UPI0028492A68|nr:formate dehydrogenase subunit gamma [Rhodoferax sp.]MDR3370660.1 formate dehydrogenase subunit gamma [Rhodoferax sp.]